ncbi:hypothetical protein C8J56DRAFT_1091523 [Mycena floridula]|nr:hypothetical protein C8J56DRAFT_1091523 [Mycena floridula]
MAAMLALCWLFLCSLFSAIATLYSGPTGTCQSLGWRKVADVGAFFVADCSSLVSFNGSALRSCSIFPGLDTNSSILPHVSPCDFEAIKSLCDSHQKHRLLAMDVKDLDLKGQADTDHVTRNVLVKACTSLAKFSRVGRWDLKPCHDDGRRRDAKTRGLAGTDQAERYVLAESTSLASFSCVRHWDVKSLQSLGDYKPCHFADDRRNDVKTVEHRSSGPADIDHVERSVQAHEQVLVRSLASFINNTSMGLVSHELQNRTKHKYNDIELKYHEIELKCNIGAPNLNDLIWCLNCEVLPMKLDVNPRTIDVLTVASYTVCNKELDDE